MQENLSIHELGKRFMLDTATHKSSHEAKAASWRFAVDHADAIAVAKDSGKVPKYDTIRRHALKDIPDISCRQIVRNVDTGEMRVQKDTKLQRVQDDKYDPVFEESSMKVRTILFHNYSFNYTSS